MTNTHSESRTTVAWMTLAVMTVLGAGMVLGLGLPMEFARRYAPLTDAPISLSVMIGWCGGASMVMLFWELSRTRFAKWFVYSESWFATLSYTEGDDE
jgi:hypothetical protein